MAELGSAQGFGVAALGFGGAAEGWQHGFGVAPGIWGGSKDLGWQHRDVGWLQGFGVAAPGLTISSSLSAVRFSAR